MSVRDIIEAQQKEKERLEKEEKEVRQKREIERRHKMQEAAFEYIKHNFFTLDSTPEEVAVFVKNIRVESSYYILEYFGTPEHRAYLKTLEDKFDLKITFKHHWRTVDDGTWWSNIHYEWTGITFIFKLK